MRILCLLMLCFTTLNSRAQNAEADVNIGVVCPEKMDNLSEAGLARLRHKIEQIGTANGVSSFLDGVFVMYPTLDIVDMQTVEGGMKNLFVIKASDITQIKTIIISCTTQIGIRYPLFI